MCVFLYVSFCDNIICGHRRLPHSSNCAEIYYWIIMSDWRRDLMVHNSYYVHANYYTDGGGAAAAAAAAIN